MDTSLIRKRGATDFVSFYNSLCAIQSSCPVASIKACAKEGVLNCHLQKLERQDWHPILTALRVNTVLHTVVFFRKWEEKAYHHFNDVLSPVRLPKRSITRQLQEDADISFEIVRAVHHFLTVSTSVISLVIEGLTLSRSDFRLLLMGFKDNSSLKHLSLKGSFIGDKNLTALCKVLKTNCILEWLDLTCCGLTAAAIPPVVTVVQRQSVRRQCSVWKDTLRGQQPCHAELPGLRRITFNINPEIGDKGACQLAEVLRDDLWIKAIDLQTCGLTSASGKAFLSTLQSNITLMVVDLRDNDRIEEDVFDSVTDCLSANVNRKHHIEDTYRWLDIETDRINMEFKSAGFPVLRQRGKMHPVTKPTTKKTTNVRVVVGPCKHTTKSWSKKIRGMPWRTAARSRQRWRHLIQSHSPGTSQPRAASTCIRSSSSSSSNDPEEDLSMQCGCVESSTPVKHTNVVDNDTSPVVPTNDSSTQSMKETTNAVGHQMVGPPVTLTQEQFKEIQEEVRLCHQRLKEEKDLRRRAEKRVMELKSENRLLKGHLKGLQKREEKIVLNGCCDNYNTQSIDNQTLETIENTLKQFHAFLDILNEKGYGHLTSLLEV